MIPFEKRVKSTSSMHLTLASFCTTIASEKHKTSAIGNSASQPCLHDETTKYAIVVQPCEKYAFFMRPTTFDVSRSMTGLNKREESSTIIFTSFRCYVFIAIFMIFRSVKSGDRLPKILSQKVEFCIRILLFSTKNHSLQKYVLYEKKRGYPPSCPHFKGKMWITLWKRWYFYTCMNMFSFVTICVSNYVVAKEEKSC